MSKTFQDALVSTDWVAAHKDDPNVRLVEVDVDTSAYDSGHIEGAIAWNWTTQLNDPVRRDILSRDQLEALLGQSGITRNTLIVLYGDNNNWFAAYAYWQLKIFGHEHVKLMNGGRKKWELEGRPLVKDVPQVQPVTYQAQEPDFTIRAKQPDVAATIGQSGYALVDVRSPQEYTGEVIAPPGMTETAQRGGHIPGAINIPWAQAVNEDGTFKSPEELRALYQSKGVTPDKDVITYCRIGERSAHTWFVLRELLGYPKVRNYDGSWTEWGSMVGTPIEK
ncbi:MAG: sulfurtransferase [Alicyclobacillus macrosporangiidus]|uniref:sulfurtransferase n=1 Tax=Alicyclobacillus macrosporangiidus TaxID=392015 RepID=UPI0026F105A3|nr:sulfurtransferase [Alicyclobacillus macrosporangiidus]MCL6598049.1 sulfurtransferase [Alicyclobacillus macrosporangiidus]